MATRKLSAAQREEIRRIIKKDLANGIPEAEILNAMAAKYSISYTTARWYLRAVTSGKKTSQGLYKRPTSGRSAKQTKAKAKGINSKRLLEVAGRFSREELRGALAAQLVLPKLEIVKKEREGLKKEAARVEKALTNVEQKCSMLEKKLNAITRNSG